MPGARFRPVPLASREPESMFAFVPDMVRVQCGGSALEEALNWCAENLPPRDDSHEKRWMTGSGFRIIYIRDKTDAAAFKLRWC